MHRTALRVFAFTLLMLGALGARAEVLDLNVNGDAFRIGLVGPLPQGRNGVYDVGGLFSSDEEDFVNLHLGALLTGDAGARDVDLNAGLGLRVQYSDYESEEGGGATLGGELHLRFPGYERVSFDAYGYYQPEILSVGDIDGQTLFGASVGYELLRGASVYVGYREVRMDFGDDDVTVDDGGHFGLLLNF